MAEITKAQYVKEQLTVQGLKDTSANRKKLRAEYDTKYGAGKSADWRDGFKLEFPQYSDWIDGEEGEARARQDFGDDLIDLFFDYAKNPQNYDLVSEAGRKSLGPKGSGHQPVHQVWSEPSRLDNHPRTRQARTNRSQKS
jgi:hypothetical protein